MASMSCSAISSRAANLPSVRSTSTSTVNLKRCDISVSNLLFAGAWGSKHLSVSCRTGHVGIGGRRALTARGSEHLPGNQSYAYPEHQPDERHERPRRQHLSCEAELTE